MGERYIWVPEPLVSPPELGRPLLLTFSQERIHTGGCSSIDKGGATRFPARPPPEGGGAPKGPVAGFRSEGARLPAPLCPPRPCVAVSD